MYGTLDWVYALPLALWGLNDLPGAVAPYSPHRWYFARNPLGLAISPPPTVDPGVEDAAKYFHRAQEERRLVQTKPTYLHTREYHCNFWREIGTGCKPGLISQVSSMKRHVPRHGLEAQPKAREEPSTPRGALVDDKAQAAGHQGDRPVDPPPPWSASGLAAAGKRLVHQLKHAPKEARAGEG